jgi:fermentation-respiration switch protein FrsA (DUF1100 family)
MARGRLRLAAGIAAGSTVLYLAALALVAGLQREITYRPDTRLVSPADAGFPRAESIRVKTADGETLVAWWVPPADSGRPVILYLHGNGGNLVKRARRFKSLTSDGAGLLAIDWRGYGGSTGTPSETGLDRDADAAYAEIRDRGIAADRIVVAGESLGTAIAVALASRSPVGGMVLDSSYTSGLDVASSTFWMFPVKWIIGDRFDAAASIQSVHAPLLIMHGTEDRVVPIRFAERLFALANGPKQFLRIVGGDHVEMTRPDVMSKVLDWLQRLWPES